jgi:hypothetical protein
MGNVAIRGGLGVRIAGDKSDCFGAFQSQRELQRLVPESSWVLAVLVAEAFFS